MVSVSQCSEGAANALIQTKLADTIAKTADNLIHLFITTPIEDIDSCDATTLQALANGCLLLPCAVP